MTSGGLILHSRRFQGYFKGVSKLFKIRELKGGGVWNFRGILKWFRRFGMLSESLLQMDLNGRNTKRYSNIHKLRR